MDLKAYCGIYGIWFENDLVYIGKIIRNFQMRFYQHKSGMKNSGTLLYCQMRKFKKESNGKIICRPIEIFKLGEVEDKYLLDLEKKYILKYNPCLNVRIGV